MAKKKNTKDNGDTPKASTGKENKDIPGAHEQAEKDIEKDPDLNTKSHREDDLDEGELARMEGED